MALALPDPELDPPDDALVRIYLRLADEWKLTTAHRATLLGVHLRTYYRWKNAPELARLSTDQRARVSYLVNIYLDLHGIFDSDAGTANEWVSRPNLAFETRPPLDVLLEGNLVTFSSVFAYVRRGAGA